jgi:hypothetical protein
MAMARHGQQKKHFKKQAVEKDVEKCLDLNN